MTTKATTEGSRLVLSVDGVDGEFRIDPVPARRGVYLTEAFLRIATGQVLGTKVSKLESESIFIECIGPVNYSTMTGLYVDLVEVDDDGEIARTLATFDPEGGQWEDHDHKSVFYYTGKGAVFVARPEQGDEEYIDGVTLRQEQAEALALCAFYWQTIVGMEAVTTFIESGEDTMASVKALTLLRTRSNPLQRQTSLNSGGTQQSGAGTPSGTHSSAAVRLPAHKKSINQNPAKRKARRG